MQERRVFSIRYKLGVLALAAVIGTLLLSGILVRDARRQGEAAAVLGAIDDLPLLAAKIGAAVHQLQSERALLSRRFGEPADSQLTAAFEKSDKALAELQVFLRSRDGKRLPPRLARDLSTAEELIGQLNDTRARATAEGGDLVKSLQLYAQADTTLISAIAALMQLVEEGELVRAILSLVSVLQFKESVSQEHALLANVFQRDAFGPGMHNVLATLATEQQVLERTFRQDAPDETQDLFDRALRGDVADSTAQMRQLALDTPDGPFDVEIDDWMWMQGRRVDSLRALEQLLAERARKMAARKKAHARSDLTTRLSLAAGVLVAPLLVAILIGRARRERPASSKRAP